LLRTSNEWKDKHSEFFIMDPDGWDRKNFQFSFFEEKITEDDFMDRVLRSTCIWKQGKVA
jgi:hypothetical protein